MNGNASLTARIDDTVDVLFVCHNFQGREYRKIADKRFLKVCSTLFVEPYRKAYKSLTDYSDLPKFGDCDFGAVSISKINFLQLIHITYNIYFSD